jgi:hypothetical protein
MWNETCVIVELWVKSYLNSTGTDGGDIEDAIKVLGEYFTKLDRIEIIDISIINRVNEDVKWVQRSLYQIILLSKNRETRWWFL